MKKCPRCGVVSNNFGKNKAKKDGLQVNCKPCVKIINAAYYKATPEKNVDRQAARRRMVAAAKVFVIEYLNSHPCVDCGETDIVVLEFDHVTGEKFKDVSGMVQWGYGLEAIANEISKCEVRCANDHRRVTAQRTGYYRSLAPVEMLA